jgi:hypothetical protein
VVDATRSARPADHAAHDPLLVAEAADRAGQLPATLAACPDCRTLHSELVALAAAVPTAALPARPRAYTLTADDAARLRPPAWRRWLAAVGTSRDTITRPLALGFTTLGLAGLLVATVPGALPGGGSTAGAAPESYESLEVAAPAAPSTAPGDVVGGNGDAGPLVGGADLPPEASASPAREELRADRALEGGVSPLLAVSVLSSVTGLGLFALRRRATGRASRA